MLKASPVQSRDKACQHPPLSSCQLGGNPIGMDFNRSGSMRFWAHTALQFLAASFSFAQSIWKFLMELEEELLRALLCYSMHHCCWDCSHAMVQLEWLDTQQEAVCFPWRLFMWSAPFITSMSPLGWHWSITLQCYRGLVMHCLNTCRGWVNDIS